MDKYNKEYTELRKAALKKLKIEELSDSALSPEEVKGKLHELNVHQIELEIQNEELRNTKLELELKKEEFQNLFEHAPSGYLILDSKGFILKANLLVQDILDDVKTNIINKPFNSFLGGKDKKLFLGVYNSFFKNPVGKDYKFNLNNKIVQITGKHRKDSKGLITLLVNIIDVTERELMTRQIKQDKELYSSIIDSGLEGFILINSRGVILDANKTITRMLGYPKDELVGTKISKIEKDENCEKLLDLPKDPLNNKITYTSKLLRKDKFLIDVEVSTSIIHKHREAFIIVYVKEITDKLFRKKINDKRIELFKYSATASIENVMLKALEFCSKITESELSFWYHIDKVNKKVNLLQFYPNNKPTIIKEKNSEDYQSKFLESKLELKSVKIDNLIFEDFLTYTTPLVTSQIKNQIIVPIVRNNSTLSFIIVANKKTEYVKEDVHVIEIFSEIVWDIRERFKTKEILLKSEQIKSTIVDVIPDVMLEINKDGTISNYFKSKHIALTFDEDKLINHNIEILFPQKVLNLAKKKILDALIQNTMTNFEYSHTYGTEYQHFSVRIVKFTEDSVLCFLRDETDKEIAKSIIIESEEKFAKAFYKSPLLKSITNLNTDQFIEVNQKFTDVTGYAKGEVLGKTPMQLGIIDKKAYDKIFDKLLSKGSVYNLKIEAKKSNGEKIFVTYNAVIINLAGNKHLLSWYEDITQKLENEKEIKQHRKNLEQLVEKRTEQLSDVNKKLEIEITKSKEAEDAVKSALEKSEELVQLKSQFMSMASHEFRTPLTTILTASELIDNYLKNNDKKNISRNSKKIQNSVQSLISILGEIIILSKADKAKIELDLKYTNIKDLVDNIFIDIEYQKKANQKLVLENNLTETHFTVDSKILDHILVNLLVNGIRYSYNDSTIKLKIENSDEDIIFEVIDNGPGIAKEDKDKIFEAFYRGKDTINIQGSGLGLSIVKKYIEICSGNISIKSDSKNGTKFTVKIPLKEG